MALPEPVYQPDDEKPVTGPNLRVLEGGGETTPPQKGHLKSVDNSSSGSLASAEKSAKNFNFGVGGSAGSDTQSANPFGAAADITDVVGKGYTSAGTVGIARFVTKRSTVSAGVIGLLIGGALMFFSLASGPLQFIHIAQLLQRFHFQSIEDNGDSRTLSLYKYAKGASQGNIENTRLGIVGKKIAERVDTNLTEIGVEKNFSKGFSAQYQGVTIDQEKFASNAKNAEELKGLSRDEFKVKFEEKFGVRLSDAPDGSLIATTDDIGGFFSNRRFNQSLIESAGFAKIDGAIATRIMGVRDGVTWHPIKKIDSTITGTIDDALTAWLRSHNQRVQKGEPQSLSATGGQDPTRPNDPSSSGANQTAADQVDEFADEAKNITKQADDISVKSSPQTAGELGGTVIQQLTESTAGKVGLGATAVVGVACAAQGIAKAADGLKHDMVVLPLIRQAMMAISLGNQLMSGEDVNMTQLSFYNKQLSNSKHQSWSTARSIQAEQGKPLTGPDIPDSANISQIMQGNMFTQIFNVVPGLTPVCNVVNSTAGTLAMTVVGVLTAPVATIGQEIVAQSGVLDQAIGSLVRWVAGSPIPSVVAGPDYGNFINYGARLAANDSMAALGGSALTTLQASQLRYYQDKVHDEALSKQSFAQRVFDPYSSDSLVARAIDSKPATSGATIASFNNVLNPSKLFGSLFSLFNRRALAASVSYDYGFPEVGFSLEEMNSQAYADPYVNGQKVLDLLKTNAGDEYISRAEKCFGVSITKDGSLTSSGQALDITKKDFYAQNNCSDPSENWTRVRFYVLDNKIAEAANCYDSGDSQSCSSVGFGMTNGMTGVATAASGSAGSIVQFARLYSWPEKWPPADRASEPGRTGPLSPKQEYAAALLQYNKSAPYNGADCGAFVATVMRASGADPDYPLASTVAQEDYVRAHPEKYTVLPTVGSVNDLLPGDVLIVNKGRSAGALGHTYIFVGGSDPKKNQASASGGDRMPNLGGAEVVDSLGRGNYLVARLK